VSREAEPERFGWLARIPVDGSEAMYRSMSGVICATSNVPTTKNVKSAALLNRSLYARSMVSEFQARPPASVVNGFDE
jgi:hypothetical protein